MERGFFVNTNQVPEIKLTEKQLTRFILAEAIKKFRELAVSHEEIRIEVSSRGGDTEGALILAELIRKADACGKTIFGLGYGEISSAATLILVACTKRTVKKGSHLMIHPVTINYPVSRLLDGNRLPNQVVARGQQIQEKVEKLLTTRTKLTNKPIKTARHHKVWFTAEQALDYGMVDEIVD